MRSGSGGTTIGGVTIEMFRRLFDPKYLGELSPQERAELKNLCEEVSAELDGPSAAPEAESPAERKIVLRSEADNAPEAEPPAEKKFVLRPESPAAAASPSVAGSPEADKADRAPEAEPPVEKKLVLRPESPAAAAAPPVVGSPKADKVEKKPALRSEPPAVAATPSAVGGADADRAAISAENDRFFDIDSTPLDESGAPVKPGSKKPEPKEPEFKWVDLKETPTEGTQRFSKYLPDERPALQAKDLATPEALVDRDTWYEAYVKEFGVPPDSKPITNLDELTSAKHMETNDVIEDSFAEVRRVQANAEEYATPDDYYKALTEAMDRWKAARVANHQTIGSATSDQYIEQLANMAPDVANRQEFGQAKKFTLDCMVKPVEAQDEEGNPTTVMQFTQIDDNGCVARAGIQKGEALIMLNGQEVKSYADMKKAIADINAKELAVVEGVVVGDRGTRTVQLRGI